MEAWNDVKWREGEGGVAVTIEHKPPPKAKAPTTQADEAWLRVPTMDEGELADHVGRGALPGRAVPSLASAAVPASQRHHQRWSTP